MTQNYISLKKITTLIFSIVLVVGGLFHSSCGEEETVAPGSDKYCLIEVTNYYAKPDGTTKNSDYKYGNVKANSEGKCPPPNIIWKNQ